MDHAVSETSRSGGPVSSAPPTARGGIGPRLQLACAWCGPAFGLVFFAGMLLAGLIPPPSPHDSAAQVAHFWQSHTDLKRLGLLLMLLAGGLTGPFGALLCTMIRRIEGRDAPMTFLQAFGAATGVVAIIAPTMVFMAAAFRPDRGNAILQMTNDLAWIPFIINFPPIIMQCLSVAAAVFTDRSPNPVFPRWVAYYNCWTAFLFIPGGLIIFFKHGPFAWNGLVGFWLAAVVFGAWFVVMSVVMTQAVKRHAAAEAAVA